MADMITGTTTGFVNNIPDNTLASVSDVRREAAEHTNEITASTDRASYNALAAVKDARFDINSRINDLNNQVQDRFVTVARDTSDLRAQVTGLGYQVRDGFTAAAKDAEINALKTQIEMAKQTTYLSDKIGDEGEKTRARINDINDRDNNRHLIERNTELVAALDDGRFWRGRFDDSQWQSLNSRLQAFQSDLQDTRQGMVNFGTMAGVGQSSTQNTVR